MYVASLMKPVGALTVVELCERSLEDHYSHVYSIFFTAADRLFKDAGGALFLSVCKLCCRDPYLDSQWPLTPQLRNSKYAGFIT